MINVVKMIGLVVVVKRGEMTVSMVVVNVVKMTGFVMIVNVMKMMGLQGFGKFGKKSRVWWFLVNVI